MTEPDPNADAVAACLADALRGLLTYVDDRPDDATADDDVRALEDAAHALNQVPALDRPRLVTLLGDPHSRQVGLIP